MMTVPFGALAAMTTTLLIAVPGTGLSSISVSLVSTAMFAIGVSSAVVNGPSLTATGRSLTSMTLIVDTATLDENVALAKLTLIVRSTVAGRSPVLRKVTAPSAA